MMARIGLGLLATVVVVVWVVFMPHTPVHVPREVARVELPCGEVLLTQTFTATVEPYIVRLYFKASGESDWAQYFVSYEAPYWWGGLDGSPSGATLTLYGRAVGTFECNGPAFRVWGRTMPELRRVSEPLNLKNAELQALPDPWS
jgi:hypothetical protein